MGWDQKDAVGELLREGDRVRVFRNFGKDEDCAELVGRVGVVGVMEYPHYTGRLHLRARFSEGYDIWVHHMSVMKVWGERVMEDINREEFQVGDSLKVVKCAPCGVDLKVGDVVECVYNDHTPVCEFKLLTTKQRFYFYNDHLQKL